MSALTQQLRQKLLDKVPQDISRPVTSAFRSVSRPISQAVSQTKPQGFFGSLLGKAGDFLKNIFNRSLLSQQGRQQFVKEKGIFTNPQGFLKSLEKDVVGFVGGSGIPTRKILAPIIPKVQALSGARIPKLNLPNLGIPSRIIKDPRLLAKAEKTAGVLTSKAPARFAAARSGAVSNLAPELAGTKERGFITTLKESPQVSPQLKKLIGGRYKPLSNQKTLDRAQTLIDTDYDIARSRIFDEPLSAETNTIGQEIMRVAQKAGRYDEAASIAEELARKGTQSGQAIQAFSIWSRMTPEGMVRYAARQIQTANKNMGFVSKFVRGVFRRPEARLDANDTQIITNLMKRAGVAGTEEEKALLVKKTWEYIGKKLPWGVSDVLDEYRYANMLSNPLTHLRNAWSNAIQSYVTRPATIVAEGRPLEAIRYELGALKALPNAIKAFTKSVGKLETFGKLDTAELAKIGPVKPRRLGLYNLPSSLMEAGDRFFSTIIKEAEVARGTPIEEASNIAQYSLFRADLNPVGQGILLNKIDSLTRAVYGLRNVGLGWFIPFIRTPMNIAKQWIEYSPAGVATIPGAASARSQLAKTMLGSIVTLMGANLALEGKTTWAAPTDPTAKKLFYDSGRKPFSVKIGKRWVPMQTFGVFALALGLPAAYKYYAEEVPQAVTDTNLDKLTKLALAPMNFWSQQTFVSGLGSFVNLVQGKEEYSVPKTLAWTAGQLKPFNGLLRYITTVIDPIYRKPKGVAQQFVSDIPGLSKGLPFYETSEGKPAERDILDYFTPYATGLADNKFEKSYKSRQQKLQSNAREKKIKQIYEDLRKGTLDSGEAMEQIMELKR